MKQLEVSYIAGGSQIGIITLENYLEKSTKDDYTPILWSSNVSPGYCVTWQKLFVWEYSYHH